MLAKSVVFGAIAVFGIVGAAVPAANSAEADAEAIVDALQKVSGKHKARASGAKGVCVKGTFDPAAEAKQLSAAKLFAASAPMLGRLSMGGGNPKISDKTKPVTRGFSMRFDLGGGESAEFVFISAPVFIAKTPEQMLAFLEARFPGEDGKPDPEKVKAFSAANPETTRKAAWLNARAVPKSFAGVNYWGVHAYSLTNAKEEANVVKLKVVPVAGELGLSEEELKAKPDNFYADELKERLGKGPAAFDFVAILGRTGDPADDATAMWPEEDRKTVKLGTIRVTAIEPDATCDAGTFDPTVLPNGIAGPAKDPMFAIRSPAYAISLSRRAN
jgi:catalase